MRQQVVPERAAAENQDLFAGLAFEFGDLLVGVRAPDDARVMPWLRLFWSDAVRYDYFVYGVIEP